MSPAERAQVVKHETIHGLHQLLGPRSESAAARQQAESLAAQGERGAPLQQAEFLQPVPARLAYPAQTYRPWSKVWLGYDALLGEIVESGVTVRIRVAYDDLAINLVPKASAYACGKHDLKPIPDIVKKLKQVARDTARQNDKMPPSAPQRVALVAIYGTSADSGYRTASGKGLIVLGRDEFDQGDAASTIAHEGSHAIFEFHSVRGDKDASARVPDALALRVAELFSSLRGTKSVPSPTGKFDPKSPPPLTLDAKTTGIAAGMAMVHDTLWAGAGGHPNQSVDEFFASAFGAYVHAPALLKEIMAYYQKSDPAIKPLATELLGLLDTVSDAKKYEKVTPPKDQSQPSARLAAIGAAPNFTSSHPSAGWFIDPSTMPSPDKIDCSVKLQTQEEVDRFLDTLGQGQQPGEKPKDQPKPPQGEHR